MGLADGERGADIYLLANSKEQAGIVFNECRDQIRASRYLAPSLPAAYGTACTTTP